MPDGRVTRKGWINRFLPGVFILLATLCAAPAAHAAEFHFGALKSEITSTPDGTSQNAHHVIDAAGASITCTSASFKGSVAVLSATEIKLEPQFSLCTFVGQSATLSMNSCAFLFKANGEFKIVDSAAVTCSANPMKFSVPSPACSVSIGPQTIEKAVTYKTILVGFTEEITFEMHASGISYSATGAGCPSPGVSSNGNYTTGNTILTTETIGSGMTDFWWG